jgi:hypothetical protein
MYRETGHLALFGMHSDNVSSNKTAKAKVFVTLE